MKRQQKKCKSFIPGVDRDNLSLSLAKSRLGSLGTSEAESTSQDESPACQEEDARVQSQLLSLLPQPAPSLCLRQPRPLIRDCS